MNPPANLVIYTGDRTCLQEAHRLSEQIGAPLSDVPGEELTLSVDSGGVSLSGYGLSLRGDFSHMLRRVTKGRLSHEMLVKAAKTKAARPVAADAAAGMGEDAFLLAASGYEVLMFEQDRVIAALLSDAMRRAAEDPALKEIVSRMKLTQGNSIELMPLMVEEPELVYLDPMFPQRRKSGLIHKKLQLLQKLERPCAQEEELLNAALSVHPRKIVIKRPLKGAFLAGVKPGYSLKGKAIRYDCIVPR